MGFSPQQSWKIRQDYKTPLQMGKRLVEKQPACFPEGSINIQHKVCNKQNHHRNKKQCDASRAFHSRWPWSASAHRIPGLSLCWRIPFIINKTIIQSLIRQRPNPNPRPNKVHYLRRFYFYFLKWKEACMLIFIYLCTLLHYSLT